MKLPRNRMMKVSGGTVGKRSAVMVAVAKRQNRRFDRKNSLDASLGVILFLRGIDKMIFCEEGPGNFSSCTLLQSQFLTVAV